jgi:hypothetical protein
MLFEPKSTGKAGHKQAGNLRPGSVSLASTGHILKGVTRGQSNQQSDIFPASPVLGLF